MTDSPPPPEHKKPTEAEVQTFREGMARLGAAITILTTDGPAGKHGMTASAVCSVTDSPPTLLVCINKSNRSHDIIEKNGVIAVNVLGGRHRELSAAFASKKSEEARFAGGVWRTMATGSPLLTDAPVAFDCKITDSNTVGSHTVFFCEVQAMELAKGQAETLIWFGRDFHHLTAI
ncbi:flavin reductase [Pseudooceanicola sediminis]|uniref:Flavin reductase n=1 Tax=Pseudooceanicola sediminis TaxID=2211117 RepID=A0A399J0C6_9RHOB|nr:flavin reductase [Pseudooceanicola sediminis]KAA2313951.1 flavin reductase [Puniceibacterium sp. HSS470]RII38815.1 flavin reductase [Pseudooceanicola sediminis]